MPAQPSYIAQNRHGTFYFRIVVPIAVRTALGLQRQIRRSLKTDSQRLAIRRARQYAARFDAVFDKVLYVVEDDGYQITNEDLEVWTAEIENAGTVGQWGAWSSPPLAPLQAQEPDSLITDEQRSEDDRQQRWSLIAQLLTGSSKRAIPKHQQDLAEHLSKFGRSLPYRLFAKLLPQQLESLALTHGLASTPTRSKPQSAEADGPTLYELWSLQWAAESKLALASNKKPKPERTKNDERAHACRLNILSGDKPINRLSLEDINNLPANPRDQSQSWCAAT